MSALESASLSLSASTDWLGRLVAANPGLWVKLGNMETRLLAPDLQDIQIEKPVYICGLARSGSTAMLEILASLPETASHHYQDFPFLFTPYWWNTLLKLMPRQGSLQERAHGDGIMVSGKSPEAMEEMLWMAFFRQLHTGETSELLSSATQNMAFEKFYSDHIRKLLLFYKARRYLSKGNYNISRMEYIQRIFPDARFIIPIRDPVTHVESLARQHRRFCEAGQKDPRIIRHMSINGHFEFGLNRVPIHTGDDERIAKIHTAWKSGNEILGLALYWDMIYRFAYEQMLANKPLGKAVLVVPYEQFCDQPENTIGHMLEHCLLQVDAKWVESKAGGVRAPDYYKSALTPGEIAVIQDTCGGTAKLYGY